MTVNISIDLPAELEDKLSLDPANLAVDVRETFAVDLYRRGLIERPELSKLLEMDRFELDACLKRHEIFRGSLTMEDLEEDYRTLQRLFPKECL